MAKIDDGRGLNRKYLRLQDLRRLRHLFFAGTRIMEGQYTGRHATPQRGQSVEFRDYREYIPGDELSAVDWKVYGRSDKLFVKIFEHQANLTVNLLVDASASMAYRGIPQRAASDAPSKYDHACQLAAAIGFLITKQYDRVSCGFARGGLSEYFHATSSMVHLSEILQAMEKTLPAGKAKLAKAIEDVTTQGRRRDLYIVISDLLEDRENVRKALTQCVSRGGEVIVFQVMHADELRLPDIEHGVFVDSESGEWLRVNVDDIRTAYKNRLNEFLEGWSEVCRGAGIDYMLCSTAEPYYEMLEQFLVRREARGR